MDTAFFTLRLGYYKPYLPYLWGLLEEREPLRLFPTSQRAYQVRTIPYIRTRAPYTRVRFDQVSRRTQLLYAQHGQNFGNKGGLSFIYQRRTRLGEYLRQATDHYGLALRTFASYKGVSLSAWGGWNQLDDQINGGIVYRTSPWEAFGKERQAIRLPQGRTRTWYRFAAAELSISLPLSIGLLGKAAIDEERYHIETGKANVGESPFSPDTIPLSWQVRQTRTTLEAQILWRKAHLYVSSQEYSGVGEAFFQRKWFLPLLMIGGSWCGERVKIEGAYGRWTRKDLSPIYWGEVRGYPWHLEIGVAHQQQVAPWLGYQNLWEQKPIPIRLTQGWIGYRWRADSTCLPFQLRLRGMRIENLWLPTAPAPLFANIWMLSPEVEGEVAYRWAGIAMKLAFQQNLRRSSLPIAWRGVYPIWSGWIQPYVRWRLPGRVPLYQLGVRLAGFTPFTLLSYEPKMMLFYPTPGRSFNQPFHWRAEPYFVVLVRRVMVYLRVEHLTERIIAPGYYLSAWYPMPGRAFAFGVQWDIYN
ncbi:MAG: putative porin [Bacteroidia bacterium]|nr:putative porin [Bacteroidia bacterium]MDW8235001.1 putative porin [Bacteroidia bacterium]